MVLSKILFLKKTDSGKHHGRFHKTIDASEALDFSVNFIHIFWALLYCTNHLEMYSDHSFATALNRQKYFSRDMVCINIFLKNPAYLSSCGVLEGERVCA